MNVESPELQGCRETCLSTHAVCLKTFIRLLNRRGTLVGPGHLGVLLDCAQIALTAADFMFRHSNLLRITCAACAEICDECADSCEEVQDEPEADACAKICRDCSRECRAMAEP